MTSILIFLNESWRPAVEILILTVGIYYAISFVRGTRGASVVMGFVGLLVTLGLVVRRSSWT